MFGFGKKKTQRFTCKRCNTSMSQMWMDGLKEIGQEESIICKYTQRRHAFIESKEYWDWRNSLLDK